MSWLKTRSEGEAQGESGGHQSLPTAGAIWRGAVPHHHRKSLLVESWLHAGRVIFLRKSWQVQQQPKSYDGSMVVGKSLVEGKRNPPLAKQRCCATIVRTL